MNRWIIENSIRELKYLGKELENLTNTKHEVLEAISSIEMGVDEFKIKDKLKSQLKVMEDNIANKRMLINNLTLTYS